MKFGKLPDIEGVDFTLPTDHPRNGAHLSVKPSDDRNFLHLYIGCTGWGMKEWVGRVYPADAKTRDYLRHYGKQFNTIELNTTHYRIPTPDTIRKWYEETPPDFRFCPKVPQTISHSRDLGAGGEALTLFTDAVQGLEQKLGCCFLQLPPYFGADRLPLLERFLERWADLVPLALELRHESWFQDHPALERLLALLHEKRMSTVLTDVAGRRDVLHMGLTTPTVLIRFVGNGLHPTDFRRADAWVERLLQWHGQGLREAYFFTHEPDNILAPELAEYLYEQIKEKENVRSRGPRLFDPEEAPGSQMRLF